MFGSLVRHSLNKMIFGFSISNYNNPLGTPLYRSCSYEAENIQVRVRNIYSLNNTNSPTGLQFCKGRGVISTTSIAHCVDRNHLVPSAWRRKSSPPWIITVRSFFSITFDMTPESMLGGEASPVGNTSRKSVRRSSREAAAILTPSLQKFHCMRGA